MKLDHALATACTDVPDLVRCALVLVSDQFAIAQAGAGKADDFMPLVRCAVRSAAHDGEPFATCAFVTSAAFVVVHLLPDRRFVLAVETLCATNLALAMSAVRMASLRLVQDINLPELVD